MSHFTVWVVQPPNDTSPQCLMEFIHGVVYSLRQLGHTVDFDPGRGLAVQNPLPARDGTFGRLIVFNAHRLPGVPLPADAIIFNAEQVKVSDGTDAADNARAAAWQASAYVALLRRHVVWDYSQVNIARLHSYGVERTVHCPVGYYPGLSNMLDADGQNPTKEDIDVLFVGSMNERRARIISEIQSYRLSVKTLNGVYGEDRDRWIARAKIVLNIHFYDDPIWEIFRVSHLVANKKLVVTEDGGCDLALEEVAKQTCAHVPYETLSHTCAVLLRDEKRRRAIAHDGFEVFSKMSQVAAVNDALVKS